MLLEGADDDDDSAIWRVVAVGFEPTEGTPDYHISSCEFLTLSTKKNRYGGGSHGRRERDLWRGE